MRKLFGKMHDKKGFTLAELLIVVAIIAVLVAVAIPVFNTQLTKSRQATALANLRSAYAEASAAYLTEDYSASNVTKGENSTVKVSGVDIPAVPADTSELSFSVTAVLATGSSKKITFDFSSAEAKLTGCE